MKENTLQILHGGKEKIIFLH